MVIQVLAATHDVHTIVQDAITTMMKIRVLRVMMAITPALIKTAHRSVYPHVKHAHPKPRVHHAKRDTITLLVKIIVTVLKIVTVKIISVCHVKTDIMIPVIHVIAYV
jgi:ABC-type antimicrobial peptide transport system permease subunit